MPATLMEPGLAEAVLLRPWMGSGVPGHTPKLPCSRMGDRRREPCKADSSLGPRGLAGTLPGDGGGGWGGSEQLHLAAHLSPLF